METARGSWAGMSSGTIFLDYHATTPCDPRVVEAMLPFFTRQPGNASSINPDGCHAATAIGAARESLAALILASPSEIIFTSSATESNNLVILGLAATAPPERRVILASVIEHKSVLLPLAHLRNQGFEVYLVPVDRQGRLDMGALSELLSNQVLLVSVQAANNEVGTLQDIKKIAAVAHEYGALVHCDGAQAVGRVPVDVEDWDVDFLSLSGHKFYGPKGVAALYLRAGAGRSPIRPIMYGGGQEGSLRPGTLNVPGIVGLGEAARISREVLNAEVERIRLLRNSLEQQISETIPDLQINGALAGRLPGNSSLTFPGVDAEALISNVPGLSLSTGSACNSGAPEPSYVLLALGLSWKSAYETIRIGLGRFTTEVEVRTAAATIIQAVQRIRALT